MGRSVCVCVWMWMWMWVGDIWIRSEAGHTQALVLRLLVFCSISFAAAVTSSTATHVVDVRRVRDGRGR